MIFNVQGDSDKMVFPKHVKIREMFLKILCNDLRNSKSNDF